MTLPAPAVAPYVPFYATLQPYITVEEFLAQPTGVDTSQLIPGGTSDQNRAALMTTIASASNYADGLCYQVLAATADMQVGQYRVQRDRTSRAPVIRVPVDFTPLIEVSDVKLGLAPGQLSSLTDLSGVWPERKVVQIPVGGLAPCGGSLYAQVAYVNGYANTALASAALQGATEVIVTSSLGVFPGMPLTIYDGATTEAVVVAPNYVLGSTTVPLVSALTGAHAVGIAVSALPRAIKQAVIALTAHLIKTRGAESVAVSGMSGGPAHVEQAEPGASEEYDEAVDLLHPFKRVV